jgi:cytochrome c-type biogenesis protein CcmH/NrfG
MTNLAHTSVSTDQQAYLVETMPSTSALSAVLHPGTTDALQRMFRDPRVLEKHECVDLVAQLRSAVELAPQVVELRVVLGMALCVNIEIQDAMEELRQAVEMDPNSYIAQLKYGELMMRLRVCDKAAEHTHQAAKLACNAAQSDLARKQAATIRKMKQEGIERGGYGGLLPRLFRKVRKPVTSSTAPVLVGTK